MQQPLISLKNASIRSGEKIIFNNIDFTINAGECWALIGDNHSSKSDLMQAIAGHLPVIKGSLEYYFENPHHSISTVLPVHDFRNKSNTRDFYYQQRYNSFDSEDAPTVESYLREITQVTENCHWNYERVVQTFNLSEILKEQLIMLSHGETKRLMIAAALLRAPVILFMDDPLNGLDVATRKNFSNILEQILNSGITTVITSGNDSIANSITHIAAFDHNEIVYSGAKKNFNSALLHQAPLPALRTDEWKSIIPDLHKERFDYIVKMQGVKIKYEEKFILDDINWEVKQGERWALSGPNGAGKSTLLSLINGDNPQAYANNIILFDRKRGTGESIWNIKKKIGFVSPELHQYFPGDCTCLQAIESGYYDTSGLFRPSDPEQATIARKWMDLLNIEAKPEQLLRLISFADQQLCLLARALIKNPPLLILDEPCQGLDDASVQQFRALIDHICGISNTTIIYVTHNESELPSSINRWIRIEKGKRVE
jgi:molybdate transport system ATP-binding protein